MKKEMPMKESGHSSDGGDKPIIITMEELHSHGDRAYFLESLINPNRVIVKGPGYVKEGNSIMPSYADSMTLQEAG